MNFRNNSARILLIAACTSLAGCASTGLLDWNKQSLPAATEKHPAVEVLCIWQPAEGRGLNGLPTRGFAGQILFFTRRDDSAVRVDGDVRISLFDDRGDKTEQGKPIHQFEFAADAWNTHLYAGQLGPTYQIFIPYTRKDIYETKCALHLRLIPTQGGMPVFSELVSATLPGPSRPVDLGDGAAGTPAEPTAAQAPPLLPSTSDVEQLRDTVQERPPLPTGTERNTGIKIERSVRPAAAAAVLNGEPPLTNSPGSLEQLLARTRPSGLIQAAYSTEALEPATSGGPQRSRFQLTSAAQDRSETPKRHPLAGSPPAALEPSNHNTRATASAVHPLLDDSVESNAARAPQRRAEVHRRPLEGSAAHTLPLRAHPLLKELNDRPSAATSTQGAEPTSGFKSYTISLPSSQLSQLSR